MHPCVLSQHLVQLLLQLSDLTHPFVFDPEVLNLVLHIVDLILEFVLLLDLRNQLIKVAFESHDFFVDAGRDFVLLSVSKNDVFQLLVFLLDLLHRLLSLILYILDLLQDLLDLFILLLERSNNLRDPLRELTSIDILGHRVPLLLHVLHHLLLVFNLLHNLLHLLLDFLDLLRFVSVLHALVRYLLLRLENLVLQRLLVLLPFCTQLVQLFVVLGNLLLEHV